MKNISNKIAFWASIFLLIAFSIWILSFVGIAMQSSFFIWTNLEDYMVHYRSTGHFHQHLAYVFMLLTGPAWLLIIHGYYEISPASGKAPSRIGLLFALGFAILSSLHYFVQLGAVRLSLSAGTWEGMEPFIQANPLSVMTSIDMLGWTLFLGLSSLFMVPFFSGRDSGRVLKYAFLVNGISCLVAGIGYLFQIDLLTFVCVNLLTGGSMVVIAAGSLKLFATQQK
jgi:hypothetical protein